MDGATDEFGNLLIRNRAPSYGLGAHNDEIVVKNAQLKNLQFLTGAGSVVARPRDLLRFIDAIVDGKFGEERRRQVVEPTDEWVQITGRANGYEAYLDYLPSKDIVFVMLSNLQSATNWQAREQIRGVLAGHGATTNIPLPPAPVSDPSLRPEAAQGVYGPATISEHCIGETTKSITLVMASTTFRPAEP
jgi:CubicO group peptidase (beta-lactamase class C family)